MSVDLSDEYHLNGAWRNIFFFTEIVLPKDSELHHAHKSGFILVACLIFRVADVFVCLVNDGNQ